MFRFYSPTVLFQEFNMDAACFQPGGFHGRNKLPSFGWHFNEWAGEGLCGSDDGRPHINTGACAREGHYTLAQRATVHSHAHTRDKHTSSFHMCTLEELLRILSESPPFVCSHMREAAGASTSVEWGRSIRATSTRACMRFLSPTRLSPWEHHLHLSFFCSCGSLFPFSLGCLSSSAHASVIPTSCFEHSRRQRD